MTGETPITEEAMYCWIIADPENWLGEPMERLCRARRVGDLEPDLVGLDVRGRMVVVEVKEETVWELPGDEKRQHVSQVLRYAKAMAEDPPAFGLPRTTEPVRPFVVGQLVDGSARARADAARVVWREVIGLVPGEDPSRPGHPKSTQWMRICTRGGVAVRLMEEYPGATRDGLATMLLALKRSGQAGSPRGANLKTCRGNVNFWTGQCPRTEHWRVNLEVTSRQHFGPDSPMVKERYHLKDQRSDRVSLMWDDGTARKTEFPAEWGDALKSLP